MKRYIVDEGSHTGLLELPDSSKYSGTILWDESVDGPIPASLLPDVRWLKRVAGKLEIDTVLKAVVEAADAAKTNKENAKSALLTNIQAYDGSENPNQTLKDLIEFLGLK